jgi:hypothetical protein
MEIITRQTTFWEFKSHKAVTRVNVIGKEEFHFSDSRFSRFRIVRSHPVLSDYRYRWQQVYLSTSTSDPDSIVFKLRTAIARHTHHWRGAERYLNSQYDVRKLLKTGDGFLLSAPEPLVKRILPLLKKGGVEFSVIEGRKPRWPMEALIAGCNFVVAKSFRLERRGFAA